MVYRGYVENGLIRLDDMSVLPEGVKVEVRVLAAQGQETFPSVCEVLKDFVGKAQGLPEDASINLDHYLYGTPKRQ